MTDDTEEKQTPIRVSLESGDGVRIILRKHCPWCHDDITYQDTKQHARECPYFSVLVESLSRKD